MQRGSCEWRGHRWTANMPDIPGADFDFWNRRAVDNPYKLKDQVFWLKEHGHHRFPD